MPPQELIVAVAKEFGGYGLMVLFAGWVFWKWLNESSARRQKRLDEQQTYVDSNWAIIRAEQKQRIADLEKEIIEIREGHRLRLQDMSAQIHAKREEIVRLNNLLETTRGDNENGWNRGRGAMKWARNLWHARSNDRQIADAHMRQNGLPPISWGPNPEPPDLEDVEPIKG